MEQWMAVGIMTALVFMVGMQVQVEGADPDLVTDFGAFDDAFPQEVDGSFFIFKGFRGIGVNSSNSRGTFKVSRGSVVEFPGLSGLGVSYALLDFGPDSVNPPHLHPRGSELLLVIDGSLTVAFVDTTNKLFKNTLYKGDMFVFPKGMVHYQINLHKYKSALAIGAFSSASPGTVSLPSALFGSGISDIVLKKSFKISHKSLKQLRGPFL